MRLLLLKKNNYTTVHGFLSIDGGKYMMKRVMLAIVALTAALQIDAMNQPQDENRQPNAPEMIEQQIWPQWEPGKYSSHKGAADPDLSHSCSCRDVWGF